jgi:C1A family cysteine protease
MRTSAPDAVDWSQKGATSAVKDQGQCGSCWAFSATEGIESAVFMATGQMPDLSTQQIISCDKTDGGCNGGDLPTAFDYVKSAGGIDTASDYPDTSHSTGSTGSCSWSKQEVAKVTGYKYAVPPCDSGSCSSQDEDGLAAALAQYGPISICVNANSLWDMYDSGILSGKCSGAANTLNHCVQLVGYDKTQGYWKVRNSWATSWGESGFIRLPYGQNACGVADEAVIVSAEPGRTNVVV